MPAALQLILLFHYNEVAAHTLRTVHCRTIRNIMLMQVIGRHISVGMLFGRYDMPPLGHTSNGDAAHARLRPCRLLKLFREASCSLGFDGAPCHCSAALRCSMSRQVAIRKRDSAFRRRTLRHYGRRHRPARPARRWPHVAESMLTIIAHGGHEAKSRPRC